MNKLIPCAAAALSLAVAAPAAMAATQLGEYLTLSGFGTLAGVKTDSNEGKFGKDRQVGGADKSGSLNVDSNLGVQLTGTATSWLSATVQVLAAKRSVNKDHIDTAVEWAFVTVKPLDGLRVRGGRMAGPVFAISDSRNIGYANTWLRAPNEVYALNFFSTYDGVDVTYRQPIGSFALTATAIAGEANEFQTKNLIAGGRDLKGLSLQLEADWLTFRVSRFEMKVDIPVIPVKGSPYSFTGFGVTVDRDNLVAQAEYVKRQVDSPGRVTANSNGWYVMGGYRFGKVLPYLIVGGTKPPYGGVADSQYVTSEQRSTAIGLRWDAFQSADIKFQIDRIDTRGTKGTSFTTRTVRPPPRPGLPPLVVAPITEPVLVFSVAVDFTF